MAVSSEGSFPPGELLPTPPSGAAQEHRGDPILLLHESTCQSCGLGHTDENLHLDFLPGFSSPQKQEGGWPIFVLARGGGWIQCCPKFSPATRQFSKSFLLGEVSFKQQLRFWKNWETSREISCWKLSGSQACRQGTFPAPKIKKRKSTVQPFERPNAQFSPQVHILQKAGPA